MAETKKLYIVATPIGNLGDISPRAAETLRGVDFVAAEDTRVTARLLNHLGIKKPLVSYYQHNMRERGAVIIDRILMGESCALCSDAGTPAISDPGELLVRDAAAAGVEIVPVPGPSAAIAALCASGMVSGRFCFEGFIPVSKNSRRERLLAIRDETRTMIFYEAPHKLKATLRDLLETLGDREMTVARELTKLHEEITRTTLAEAAAFCEGREPRGEYVLVVAGCSPPQPEADRLSDNEAVALALGYIETGLTPGEACRRAAAESGHKRSELYKLVIKKRDEL